jgi:hypothetical protein
LFNASYEIGDGFWFDADGEHIFNAHTAPEWKDFTYSIPYAVRGMALARRSLEIHAGGPGRMSTKLVYRDSEFAEVLGVFGLGAPRPIRPSTSR